MFAARETPTQPPPPPERTTVCAICGRAFERATGRGRPRKFCTACVPPGDLGASHAAWRITHDDGDTPLRQQLTAKHVRRMRARQLLRTRRP